MITHLETFSLLFNRNVNSEIWDTAVSVSSSWFFLKEFYNCSPSYNFSNWSIFLRLIKSEVSPSFCLFHVLNKMDVNGLF